MKSDVLLVVLLSRSSQGKIAAITRSSMFGNRKKSYIFLPRNLVSSRACTGCFRIFPVLSEGLRQKNWMRWQSYYTNLSPSKRNIRGDVNYTSCILRLGVGVNSFRYDCYSTNHVRALGFPVPERQKELHSSLRLMFDSLIKLLMNSFRIKFSNRYF